ncbi:MAG: DUF1285 domain-containing protein [Hyphomicrobiales bacterium]|jgi:uncharacterized protein|nr:DUF1285 domain-containing protein [Hyphomicrobiales bacterium]|tara:strand:+ start:131 stop:631 length:501 start_codon:yes stop_codon:yes gene_type:complete
MQKKNNEMGSAITSQIKFFIDEECRWFFEGSEIKRQSMVCLFAKYLQKDSKGEYNIITPYEIVRVRVANVPFKVIKIWIEGIEKERNISIETNVGDVLEIKKQTAMRFSKDPSNKGIVPYINFRDNIEAIFTRSTAHDLISHCNFFMVNSKKRFGFWSNNTFFPID